MQFKSDRRISNRLDHTVSTLWHWYLNTRQHLNIYCLSNRKKQQSIVYLYDIWWPFWCSYTWVHIPVYSSSGNVYRKHIGILNIIPKGITNKNMSSLWFISKMILPCYKPWMFITLAGNNSHDMSYGITLRWYFLVSLKAKSPAGPLTLDCSRSVEN